MNIAFFVRHFTERGTEVAIYDYAKYNEEILNNKSYIICFNEATQRCLNTICFPSVRFSYDKFKSKFVIIEINNISDMKHVIEKYNLNFFHTLCSGGNDVYDFNNKQLWGKCKTIKHCVFDTTYPESDFYITISQMLNHKNNTSVPIIPHIVHLPLVHETLRTELNIPETAIVLGRYGGTCEFNIPFVHDAIKQYLYENENVIFLFMNTDIFYTHPRIIYVDRNIDIEYKVKFINTCDAMIHGRLAGETFGLSIAEFSSKNKPIITCVCGDLEHIKLLKDTAILYTSKETLITLFENIKTIIHSRNDWNMYSLYSPDYVMNLFKSIFDTYSL
jgi:hypothetical protein